MVKAKEKEKVAPKERENPKTNVPVESLSDYFILPELHWNTGRKYAEETIKAYIDKLKEGIKEETNQLWALELIDKIFGPKLT